MLHFGLVLLATFLPTSYAKTFLAMDAALTAESAPEPATPGLLEELESIIGTASRQDVELRAKRLEEAARPMFMSMPKMAEKSTVGPEAARYMLHRIFVDRHGWYIRGLAPTGDSWNSSSPMDTLEEHLGDELPDILGDHFESAGLSLHHVAVLAATLESLVHSETQTRLQSAFRLVGHHDMSAISSAEQVKSAIDTYMLLYVVGINNHAKATKSLIKKLWAKISDAYPNWEQTRSWAQRVHSEVLNSTRAGEEDGAFTSTMGSVEAIADQYGRWQNRECLDLKASLMEMEEAGTGRVPLQSFYGAAVNGKWQFSESLAYLQQLGALDESDSSRPAVIIPNYVNSPSNCVAASKFYSVCCMNECESLMGHLETQLASPEASAERILEIVSHLPSSTVEAPRILPDQLAQRLGDVAAHHGGKVPLHGRLFSQWLHHAYPRECPFPHLSGTTKPMTSREWMAETGESSTCSQEMLEQHLGDLTANAALTPSGGDEETDASRKGMQWSMEEELFIRRKDSDSVPKGGSSKRRAWWWSASRNVVFIVIALSMLRMLMGSMSQAVSTMDTNNCKSTRYLV